MVAILLNHGASTSCLVEKQNVVEWASLNCKHVYNILKVHKGVSNIGFEVGDLVDAANWNDDSFKTYLQGREGLIADHQVEKALYESMPLLVTATLGLLEIFIKAGADINKQGTEALVRAAMSGQLPSAAFLIHSEVDVNAPRAQWTPLRSAASNGRLDMIEFLLDHGADVNSPAHPIDGRTALQEALENEFSEFVCHNYHNSEYQLGQCRFLLDANAPVKRPNGKPSSALHGAIDKAWHDMISFMLEPQRNAIINHMWHDTILENMGVCEPKTPTQLAAESGQLETVKLLISRSADVNAKPAVWVGITALQGAAISGNIMVAKLLIESGADVNGSPSYVKGRFAIEGAAEHGRLDMVQLLLNAGARGNLLNGTGFEEAIRLALDHGHVTITNMLKELTP
ncbi:ankyrin repeat-containing domain protein [Dactylonectria estremocensis]|uniref:Ankyrin repeat-containing domain protein n=1 Tax=Dactylonectria estremocensis TaxID=1079267 RepID=A0A9P9IPG6_9HYPO|nr:ankyrin repeat-containing domain protein [Dactylonectria estremocensis]